MKDKLLEIINHYGVLPQLKYFQSEVFELNEAIITYEFASADNVNLEVLEEIKKWNLYKFKEHIIEEISDVLVMLKQFQYKYGITEEEVEEMMMFKCGRQLERIKNENRSKNN